MRGAGVLAVVLCLCAGYARYSRAQEPRTANAEAIDGDTAAERPVAALPVRPPDAVILRSGSVFAGVRIIRSTLRLVEFEFVPAGVRMTVPRSQVVNIIRGGRSAAWPRESRAANPGRPEAMFSALKLTREFMRRLTAPISDCDVDYEDEDFTDVLRDVAARAGIAVEFTDTIMAMPPAERRWTLHLDPEATLLSLFRDDFKKVFPDLNVVYHYDKVVVTKKPRPGSSEKEGPQGGAPEPGGCGDARESRPSP